MISQGDIEGRLRLLRYGLIVVVVVAFLVALLAPFAIASPWATEFNELARAAGVEERTVAITDYLGSALLATVITAVVCAVIYFAYSTILKRQSAV